jgi:hypothetical protein
MPDASDRRGEKRLRLEKQLVDAIVALRGLRPGVNITLRVRETGDFVAVLPLDEHESSELAEMLRDR